ncbi:MAG: integral rane sensor signal transduction histidine kinase, partial [Clostridia bacterium]|nr:integral rane sensor signal transduction histidine kinase [Clostridia bacterium]
MRTSIQFKIVMIYLSIIFMIMMVSGTFIVYNIEQRDYKNIHIKLEKRAEALAVALDWQNGLAGSKEDIISKMSGIDDASHIYILDSEGKVNLATSSQWLDGETVKSEVVIRAISTKKPATAQIKHFVSRNTGPEYTDHALPIIDQQTGEITAIIYVAANVQEVYDNMMEVMKTIASGSLIAMFITGLFGIVFSKMITSPIKQLTTNAKRFAAGDYIKRIPIESNDEIGELTQSFNYMATQLGNTMEAITSEKNKLEKIFEHMADGVMAFDREGVLIHANSVCYEMIGALNMNHRFDYIFPKLGVTLAFSKLLQEKQSIVKEDIFEINKRYLNMHFAPYENAKGE